MEEISAHYYAAEASETPRCIGLKLRPYSLGHRLTLLAAGNSFVIGEEWSFQDLILGVLVCSQTRAEWEKTKGNPFLGLFLKFWGWKAGKFNIAEEGKKFARYILDGSYHPEVNLPASGGKELVSPWEVRLKMFLMRELHLTEAQAMDRPLSLAWLEFCAHGEVNGSIELFSEADRQSVDFIKSDEFKAMVAEEEAKARAEHEARKAREN